MAIYPRMTEGDEFRECISIAMLCSKLLNTIAYWWWWKIACRREQLILLLLNLLASLILWRVSNETLTLAPAGAFYKDHVDKLLCGCRALLEKGGRSPSIDNGNCLWRRRAKLLKSSTLHAWVLDGAVRHPS